MKSTPTRRQILCGLCATPVAACSSGPAAAPHRLYCRFSVTEGWTNRPHAYAARRLAGPNDSSGVPQATSHILKVLSFAERFEIWMADGENNAMTTIQNGRRIIVVDVGFLANLNRVASTRWAAIQVLAHEIGHHLARADDPHENELQADYWSGRALRLLGSARNAASASILAIGTTFDTQSHPNKYTRARAIERGWDNGGPQ